MEIYHDGNDGKPWTTDELDDLKLEFENGGTVESAARFLSRQDTVEDPAMVRPGTTSVFSCRLSAPRPSDDLPPPIGWPDD